jgi:hypothetical protein
MLVSLPSFSASASGFGAIALDLTGFISGYSSYSLLEFQVERRVGGGEWSAVGQPFQRVLSGSPQWYDINTPLRVNLYYRVGFRRPDSGSGFVFLDDLFVGPVMSEGSAIADEEPPVIQVFLVNGGVSPAISRYVPAELVASDNRTPADQLLVQFEVNGQARNFDGSAWRTGGGWGPYLTAYSGLDLGTVNGQVKVAVRVKDVAGNVGTKVAYLELQAGGGYAVSGTVTIPGGVTGTYDGEPAIYIRTDTIQLNLSYQGAAYMRIGIEGFPYSDWEPYSPNRKLTLPKSSGLVTLTVMAKDAAGTLFAPVRLNVVVDPVAPVISSLRGLNGATATRTSSATLEIAVTDNLPGTLQYRYCVNGGAWSSWVSLTGNTISVSGLVPGANRITVEVKDQAGNTAQAAVTIFRV